jgi:hypothetical protein
MRTTSTDRMRRTRRRRRFGMQFVTTEISEEAIKLLEKQGYLETRTPASMGLAITALLSDLVLDTA